jgi:hypothetical protein
MAISDLHASTIVEVQAHFGFSRFDCHPDEITRALGIAPDDVRRKGELRRSAVGRDFRCPWSVWTIDSRSNSKDVNDHLRELLSRLVGVAERLRSEFGQPNFNVHWVGNYLYAGSGPFYEADVIAGMAGFGAMLWQDIYQVDQEETE